MSADDSDHRVTQEFQEDMDMFDWAISDADMSTLDAVGPMRPVRCHCCLARTAPLVFHSQPQQNCNPIDGICTDAALSGAASKLLPWALSCASTHRADLKPNMLIVRSSMNYQEHSCLLF